MTHYSPAGGVRDRAKTRIRNEIVSVSLRLFAERGYEAVTTQEIADSVGVTQRTLFRYFARKDMILFQADHDYVERFERYLDETIISAPTPFEAVASAFQSLAAYYDENRGRVSLIYGLIQGSEHLRLIEQRRQQKIDLLAAYAMDGPDAYRTRETPPSLPSRIIAAVLFGAIRPIQRAWIRGELTGALADYAAEGWAPLGPIHDAARSYAEKFTASSQD